jgi:glutamate formiminotransferase/formiminotetrahydrofolate cyclodeaminase
MVANLSSHKRGWDDRWEFFSEWAEKGQDLLKRLLFLVDEDTRAFDSILQAFRMPKETQDEIQKRKEAIESATRYAIEVPFVLMQTASECFPLLNEMVDQGNPNSVSDAGVGAICTRAAIHGAWLNVRINAAGIEDKESLSEILKQAEELASKANALEQEIVAKVNNTISG